ncbi:unnamed protein product [Arctogadus glacialis]
MDCSSEDAHRSDISNWNRARDPRTLSPLSSPTMDSSASSIEDTESQVSEAQVSDEHVQSGGVAMETADLKAAQPGHNRLQEYAIYLAGLNLSFLHIGEDSETEGVTVVSINCERPSGIVRVQYLL